MPDRNVVIRLRGEIGDFQAKMVAAGKSVSAAANKMTGAEKEAVKFRQGLDSIGAASGKIGLAAAAGVAVAVKAFADFDKAMSSVKAATHASAQEMDDLRKLALQTGADTAFSAVEAADGIEQLAKAGVATADIMGGALQGALDLAAAGTVEVGFAAETAATAMTQFGLSGDRVPHIADLLAAAAGKAQGEVSDMSMALKQSGLVADQVGLSLEETTGGLAAMASAGLLGSDAGTSFKTMLMRLLPTTKEAGDAMESIGFSAFDAQGNMRSLTEIAGGLQSGLRDMSAEQRQATLQTIFGQDAIRAATVLYEQGAKGIDEWVGKVNDQGYAAETAAIKMDNLSGDLEKLKGALSTLFIEGGENGDGFLRGATQSTEDFVNALSELPDWATKSAFYLAGITAILGGGLWFGSKVIQGVADTRVALDNLNISAGRAQSALRGVGAALVLTAAYQGLDLLLSKLQEVADLKVGGAQLPREMEALLDGKFVGNLGELRKNLNAATDGVTKFTNAFYSWAPGNSAIEQAEENISAVDEQLASLVEGGRADAAAMMFEAIATEAAKSGVKAAEVAGQFDQYALALDNANDGTRDFGVVARTTGKALEDVEGPAGRSERSIDGVGRAARGAASDAEALDSAIGDLEATLTGNQRARDYEQSLDDIADRLKERRDLVADIKAAEAEVTNAKTDSERESAAARVADLKDQLKDLALTLDIGTQAGRDWSAALEGVALDALEAASDLEGMDRVRYLNNARKDFIDLATKITGSRKKAVELADELELLHQKPVKPNLDVNTKDAERDVRKFYRWLEGLPPIVVSMFVDNLLDTQEGKLAGGGKTPRGFASGGWTGNAPVNAVAGVVHGQEYVVPAGPAAEYRAFLDRISRKVPGYREGGYVAAQSSTTNYYGGGEQIDYDRLTSAILRARPLYRDAIFQSAGDYEKAKRDHARQVAGGGVRF